MFGEDATDVRALVLSQYASPDVEIGLLSLVRRAVRMHYKAEIHSLRKRVKNPKTEYDKKTRPHDKARLAALEVVWRDLKLDMEGDEELAYCEKLVNERRGALRRNFPGGGL